MLTIFCQMPVRLSKTAKSVVSCRPGRGLGIFWPLNPQLKQRAIFERLV